MRTLTEEIKKALQQEVYEFMAEESDMEVGELRDDLSVVDDLDGDSLMFVELIGNIKTKYKLDIKLQSIGKYLLKHPTETVGGVVEICYLIYQYENGILELGM